MFKHTVTYKDFNGKQHTEDLYFHLSSPEVLDLNYNPMLDGDMANFIREGIGNAENRKLWIIFKLLILNSYGRRSEDGARFSKKAEWTDEFLDSPPYEKFFEWLLLDSPDGKHAKEFYNAIMPDRLKGEMGALDSSDGDAKQKLRELSHEELQKLYLEKLEETKNPKVIEG